MATHQHAADSVAADDVAHHVATKLAEIGQRFTSGRRDIVAALSGADRPLSIPEILSSPEVLDKICLSQLVGIRKRRRSYSCHHHRRMGSL